MAVAKKTRGRIWENQETLLLLQKWGDENIQMKLISCTRKTMMPFTAIFLSFCDFNVHEVTPRQNHKGEALSCMKRFLEVSATVMRMDTWVWRHKTATQLAKSFYQMKLLKAWRASYSKWGMGSQGKLWNNLTLAIAFQGLLQFILPFVAKIEPICSELNVCGTVSKRWWPAHHKWVDLLPYFYSNP